MIYIFGIITGIVLSTAIELVVMLVVFKNKDTVVRSLSQMESRFKKRGKILEPEDEELSDWINKLPTE